jgi:hypothetical protein
VAGGVIRNVAPGNTEVITMRSPRGRKIAAAVLGTCAALMMSWAARPATAASGGTRGSEGVIKIQGILFAEEGKVPVFKTSQGSYKLEGQSPYLLHTLQDKRLLKQELRLVGTVQPNGAFQVRKMFAVHGGKLYRIEYYCDVCNIVAVQPGRCVCCQRPTKLREVPVSGDTD